MATGLKVVDVSKIREVNSKAVLAALRARGRIGRREIAEMTGLSFATVCRLVDEFEELGVIIKVDSTNIGKAKRKTALLDINPAYGWVVALDLGASHIRASAMDLSGKLHSCVESPINNVVGESAVAEAIMSSLREVIDIYEPSRATLLGVGVSSSGIVSDLGVVELSFNLQLRNFLMARVVQQVCDVPVVVHNDVVASTVAEARVGHGREHDNFAYLTVGVGVGGGYVINGEVYPLSNRSQFGLMVVAPEGEPTRFGGRGYLESLVSGRAIEESARKALEAGEKSLISELVPKGSSLVTAESVAKAAQMGDEFAKRIMAEAAGYLGIAIVNIAHILGLKLFVINGGLSHAGDVLWEPLRESVRKYEYWPGEIQLEPVTLEEDVAVLGAGLLALDKAFESISLS